MLIHTFVNTTVHEDKKPNAQQVSFVFYYRVYCEKEKALKY
jgi:hypothetical protein